MTDMFRFLALLMMAFSILLVVLKMGSLYIAITLFFLGLILYIFGKKNNKK